jgi:hypothetical protein
MSAESCFERDLVGDTSKHDRGVVVWLASALRATASSRGGAFGGALVAVWAIATWSAHVLWAIPLLFTILFAARLLDGRARQSALRRARIMPMRLPAPMDFSDGPVRNIIQRLAEARQAIGQVLDDGPRSAGFDLASSVAHVPGLERDVVVFAQRAEYVARFLSNNPVGDLLTEERRQEERIQREEDPDRAEALRRAGAQLKERLAAVTALKEEHESLIGAAKTALVALETLPAKMMLLQLQRLQACHAPSATLTPPDAATLQEVERALTATADVSTPRA